MCKHPGFSGLTGKRVKGNNDSAMEEHYFAIILLVFDFFYISQHQKWLQSYLNRESFNQQKPISFEYEEAFALLFYDWGT